MPNISKPNKLNLLWASGGDILDPGDTKYQTGWGVEVPPRQWENYIQNKQDQAIAHINQHGIAVWDSETEYQAGKSFVQGVDGGLYFCITTHSNQNPLLDGDENFWVKWCSKNKLVVIGTPGSGNWTVPAILRLGAVKAKVTVIGGGGGGGYGGGSGAGTSISVVDLTGISTVSYTVGLGGTGSLTSPTNGGQSSFGTFALAGGGFAGSLVGGVSSVGRPGGGTATVGDLLLRGEAGAAAVQGGKGGNSSLGMGGAGSSQATTNPAISGEGGSGGGGAAVGSGAGNGGNGIILIEY